MARAIEAAYDAFLDALKGDYYYITPTQPTTAGELNAARLNDAGSFAASNGANEAGVPNGRQFTVAAATGVLITSNGQAAYITQATGSGDANDVPVHSIDIALGGQPVVATNTVNVNSYVIRAGALTSQ